MLYEIRGSENLMAILSWLARSLWLSLVPAMVEFLLNWSGYSFMKGEVRKVRKGFEGLRFAVSEIRFAAY